MAARSVAAIVPGWLTIVSARGVVANAPVGARYERSARMIGSTVRTSYPYVLPPIVGASSSVRSPALFASVPDGRYRCAAAASVPGEGRRAEAARGTALASA